MAGELRRRGLIILGLSGLAVAQPLLDLFGKNPEFFVAGNYSGSQIVWFALLIVVVPPVVGTALTAVAMLVSRRAGTIVFALVVTVLAAAFGLALLRALGVDQVLVVTVLALAAGAAVAVLVARARGVRLFLSYLAAANLFFLASFLFFSPTAELVEGGSTGDLGHVVVPPLRGPVVVIVLDELPAATIMRPDGSLNAARYPGFAELASVSTWFRNTSSQYNLTHRAVPAILDGRLAERDDLPTYSDHPRNLFSLLGRAVPISRYESVTNMCSPAICEPPPRQPLRQAIEDASVVYGHRVLPATLRADLPPIDNSWGSYGAQNATATASGDDLLQQETGAAADAGETLVDRAYARWRGLAAAEKSPAGQAAVLADRIEAIDGSPAVHFVHVALPHRPWVLSRTGMRSSYSPEPPTDPDALGYAFRARMEYQLHSMQVGAADTLVGQLVDHLRSLDTWKDTLLVVTSDHGTNLTPPNIGRMKVTAANREEVYRVPLFIKAPGQVAGSVRDDSAQNLDVLPSIVDLLDVDTDWKFDGHSLYDGTSAHTEPKVSTDVEAAIAIAQDRAQDFPYGDDWMALAAVGDNGDLVGTEVADLTVGEPSELRATLAQSELLDDLPAGGGELPFVLVGKLSGGTGTPPDLVASVNGTIAGVVGGYRPRGDGWRFVGYVADLYRDGHNDVELWEVTRQPGGVVLHATRACCA